MPLFSPTIKRPEMASMDSSQSQESSASAFFKRYERLRIADEEKNTLIEVRFVDIPTLTPGTRSLAR